MPTVSLHGHPIDYVRLPSARPRDGMPATVFLHEGLGAIGLWRDFPQRVADATGSEAIVFSRIGYGQSAPFPAPRTVRYLHEQAEGDLPALIDALGLVRPFLFGHSDGGSIALIAAAMGQALSGIVVLAPHVMVEPVTLEGIRAADAAWRSTDWPARLARHHRDAGAVFAAWRDIWLSPSFRDWNIEAMLPDIACPVLAIQGEGDEYATMAQIDRIAEAARGEVRLVKLPECGHSPHKDQPDAVIAATRVFLTHCLARD
jgi:pimeloyl-ACP methyl ester carboxylesterase